MLKGLLTTFALILLTVPEATTGWTLKFEMLEVYPGKKYDDTVISEIYFDGIDVY